LTTAAVDGRGGGTVMYGGGGIYGGIGFGKDKCVM